MKPNNEITKDTVAAPETRKWMQREKDTWEKKHLCVIRWKDRKEHFFCKMIFSCQKKHLCIIRWIVAVKGRRNLGCHWKRAYLKVHVFFRRNMDKDISFNISTFCMLRLYWQVKLIWQEKDFQCSEWGKPGLHMGGSHLHCTSYCYPPVPNVDNEYIHMWECKHLFVLAVDERDDQWCLTDCGPMEAVLPKNCRWWKKEIQREGWIIWATCWGKGMKVMLCWSGKNSSLKKTVPVANDMMITLD